MGQPARALPYLEEAASMEESLGGATYENFGISEYMVGQMRVELGDTQAGDDLLRRSIEISEHNGADYWAALASQALTWSALAQGDGPAALKDAERSLSLLEKAARPSVLIPIVNVARGWHVEKVWSTWRRGCDGVPRCSCATCPEACARRSSARRHWCVRV